LVGESNLRIVAPGMGAEDFAYYAQVVPGFYFSTGARPKDKKASEVAHHTPDFLVDENSMNWGVKALCHLTVDYMEYHSKTR